LAYEDGVARIQATVPEHVQRARAAELQIKSSFSELRAQLRRQPTVAEVKAALTEQLQRLLPPVLVATVGSVKMDAAAGRASVTINVSTAPNAGGGLPLVMGFDAAEEDS